MIELMQTNDPVRLSWAQALLKEAGIESLVLDAYTSIVEGSIGAIPRRLMVAEEDASRARYILAKGDESLAEP
jgi:Putative prokaryotic signal transducing protein